MLIKKIDCDTLQLYPEGASVISGEATDIKLELGYNTSELTELDFTAFSNGSCSALIEDSALDDQSPNLLPPNIYSPPRWWVNDANLIEDNIANPIDGAITAENIDESDSNSVQRLSTYNQFNLIAGSYKSVFYIKGNQRSYAGGYIGGGAGTLWWGLNLDTGVFEIPDIVTFTGVTSYAEDIGDDWWKITINFTAPVDGYVNWGIGPRETSGVGVETYTGTSGKGLYFYNPTVVLVDNLYILKGLVSSINIVTPSGTKTYNVQERLYVTFVNLHSESQLALFEADFAVWLVEEIGVSVAATITESGGDITILISNLPVGTYLENIELSALKSDFTLFEYLAYATCIDNSITLTPEDLGQTGDEFTHGVYQFKLTYTTNAGQTVTETFCIFIDCGDFICDVANYMADCSSSGIQCDYFMLYNLQECNCACDTMLDLYNKILATLEDDPCGTKFCSEC